MILKYFLPNHKFAIVAKGLVSPEDCKLLSDWAMTNIDQFVPGIEGAERTTLRVTTRLNNNVQYPERAFTLRKELESKLRVNLPIMDDKHGNDGMLCVVTYPGIGTYNHIDPPPLAGGHTLRMNVLCQKSDSGGVFRMTGVPIDLELGDVVLCLVSASRHRVTPVEGNTPRILWLYGYETTEEAFASYVEAIQ